MINKLVLSFFTMMLMSASVFAQSPVGIWKTVDDETGESKSHVEIFEQDGKLYGKIIKLLLNPSDSVCDKCTGDKKNQPILGMQILSGLKKYKDYWSYGEILDPSNGKVYKCSVWLEDDGKLKLRGYIGISAMGRNQYWIKVE